MHTDRYKEFLAGDKAAEKELFSLVYIRLLPYAERYLPQKEEAKDVVMVKVDKFFTNRHKYPTYPLFKNHLYTAVRNLCHDKWALLKKEQKTFQELPPVDDEVEMIAGHIKDELIEIVLSVFLELPEQMRKPLEMEFFQGRNLREIADELNKPYDNLVAYKHKVIKRLKEMLRKQGINIPISLIFWYLLQS